MKYKMSDAQFLAELRIRAYMDQINSFPFGDPQRQSFKPEIATIGSRADTLAMSQWGCFTDDERAAMLATLPAAA